jgi:hypothetical protein
MHDTKGANSLHNFLDTKYYGSSFDIEINSELNYLFVVRVFGPAKHQDRDFRECYQNNNLRTGGFARIAVSGPLLWVACASETVVKKRS